MSEPGSMKKQNVKPVSKTVVVRNSLGMHGRPCMCFVDRANQFASEIVVEKLGEDEEYKADGKSFMQMVSLAPVKGSCIAIHAIGEDAEEAVKALSDLVESGFGEYFGLG